MRLRSTANRNPEAGAARELFTGGTQRHDDDDLLGAGLIRREDMPEVRRYQQQHGVTLAEAALALGKVDVDALQSAGFGRGGFTLLPDGDDRVDPLVRAAFSTVDLAVTKVRAVRSRILSSLTRVDDPDRPTLIAVVGIGSGEETALLSANLAVVFAQLGSNTLLVDCGIDRPTMHTLFRISNEAGVTNHLESSQASLAIQKSAIPRLWVMPAGPEDASASAYLHRRSLADVIGQWAPGARIVVALPDIDVAATPLGSTLNGFDSVLLVARKGETSVADVRRAIDELDAKSVPVAGSVIG